MRSAQFVAAALCLAACSQKIADPTPSACSGEGVAVSNGDGTWTCKAPSDLAVGSVLSVTDHVNHVADAGSSPTAQFAKLVLTPDSFVPDATWLIGSDLNAKLPVGSRVALINGGLEIDDHAVPATAEADLAAPIATVGGAGIPVLGLDAGTSGHSLLRASGLVASSDATDNTLVCKFRLRDSTNTLLAETWVAPRGNPTPWYVEARATDLGDFAEVDVLPFNGTSNCVVSDAHFSMEIVDHDD